VSGKYFGVKFGLGWEGNWIVSLNVSLSFSSQIQLLIKSFPTFIHLRVLLLSLFPWTYQLVFRARFGECLVFTRNAMEKRIDGLEQQLEELKNLIISRNWSRCSRPHQRRPCRREKRNVGMDGEVDSEETNDRTSYTSRSMSRVTHRKTLGVGNCKFWYLGGEDAYG